MANDIVLETRGLVKKFGDAVILNGIDFTLHDKEVAVILGPSGCGKSTFLRCLIGLEPIQGGNILLKGKPLEFGSTLRSGSTSSRGLTGWLPAAQRPNSSPRAVSMMTCAPVISFSPAGSK